MRSLLFKKRTRHVSSSMLFLGVLVVLMLVLAACGNSSTAAPNPLGLINPGVLTVGSDTTYPPQEFVDTATGKATGFDVDLITAMATQMGLKVNIVKADFGTIIDSLGAKRYDVVISAVTINATRKAKVDFVPYFSAGESLLVPKGNPRNLTAIGDACGLKIGVQNGTVEQDDTTAADKACKAAGKAGITITALENQTDVVQLLATGRVDATYQDSPVTDYYLSLNPGQFKVGGS
ncbi:MAG: ABC transporter substrate-binding protein, partial [Ktedonobacteraceae bacterium]